MVFLFGVPGSGKTYLAVAMLREILSGGILPPSECFFLSEGKFLADSRPSFDSKGDRKSLPSRCLPHDHPNHVRFLIFDDLGSSSLTDWCRAEISALIAARHGEDLPTILTSNIVPHELPAAIDGRATSRIAESGMLWRFPPRDLRMSHGEGASTTLEQGGLLPPQY
jgi:DNA replication protein DnaC